MDPSILPVAGRAERFALRFVQLGAIAVVLAVSICTAFDLDRFLVPKELALHLTAVAAALLALRTIRRTLIIWLDLLLIAYLLLGALSVASRACAAAPQRIFIGGRGGCRHLARSSPWSANRSFFAEPRTRGDAREPQLRRPCSSLWIADLYPHSIALEGHASAGMATVAASLVLTRSRAAWVASAVLLLVFLAAMLMGLPPRCSFRTRSADAARIRISTR